MYKFNNVDKILLVLIVAIGFGCTAPKKEGLEVIWQESQQPFWVFLKKVSLPYGEKVALQEGHVYDAYGIVSFVNHHTSVVRFETFQETLNVMDSYHLPGGDIIKKYSTSDIAERQTQQLAPGDTARFYLVFKTAVKGRWCPDVAWQPDSIDNVFDYKIKSSPATIGDSVIHLNLLLKKTYDQSYAMDCKVVDKNFVWSKPKSKRKNNAHISHKPLAKDFAGFAANFPYLSFQNTYVAPQFATENIAPDSAKIISENYMARFVHENLWMHRGIADSLIWLEMQEVWQLNGQYVGKIKHPNEGLVTVLLIKLSDPDFYYTKKQHAYYMLGYYNTATGEDLGYDLLSGIRKESRKHAFHGKFYLRKGSLIIEKVFFEGFRNYGQKYMVDIGQKPTIEVGKRGIAESTFLLAREAKEKQGVEYKTYCNKQLNYCIDLPYKVFTCIAKSTEEDGDTSEEFASEKGELSMFVHKEPVTSLSDKWGKTYLEKYYNHLRKTDENPFNKYHLGKDYFTLTTTHKDDIIIYRKYIIKGVYLMQIGVVCPKSKKQYYDKIVQQIFISFK